MANSDYQQEMAQYFGDPPTNPTAEPSTAADDGDREAGETDNENMSFSLRQFHDDGFIDSLIKSIPSIALNPSDVERQTYRLKDILDRYQEQPQLVDPFLGRWVQELIVYVKAYADEPSESSKKTANLSLTVLRLLTKLRGYKVIIKFLPHSVADVEQSLGLVEEFMKPVNSMFEDWEQQYMLLLWLSVAVQIPFDLKKLTDPDDIGTPRSIEARIFHICQVFITVSEKTRDAAAYLLSRFVTRPDMLPIYGKQMIDYLLKTLESAKSADVVKQPHILCGGLAGIAMIFKSGTRSHLCSLAEDCLPRLMELGLLDSQFSMVRKYCTKAFQRLALTFLPTKLPTWRYKRGFRSLEDNMAPGNLGAGDVRPNPMGNGVHSPFEESETEVSAYVEQVIGLLLQSLNDADGIIRWSAAKGIGRISERLPQGFAEDVLNGVLNLFSYERSENAWHGGCLALAELSRRGALLPLRFSDVMPVVLKALLYEELRGTYAVGSPVRDAACYVCWAFARAYEPKDLEEFVMDVAKHLVLTALFDRSVNCRRAASSAFQEHVGRQGNFPRGLDIIPILDFESLGRRSNTYMKLSPIIAKYQEYTSVILDFLLSHPLAHWDVSPDSAVRELAAQTLFSLTPVAPDYMKHCVAPELLKRIGSNHIFTRHGAMIGLGYICEGLHNCGQFDDYLASQINPKDVFRGFGHELIRQAVMSLISRVSNAELPLHNKPHLLGQMVELVQSSVVVDNPKIQEIAVNTLQSLLKTYGTCMSPSDHNRTLQEACLDQVLHNVKSSSELMRRYSVLVLSVFSAEFATKNLSVITNTIVSICPRSSCPEPQWVDCRRNCCRSLDRLLGAVPARAFSSEAFSEVVDFLGDCLSDYTEDKRGNIGRIVRLAAIDTTRSIMTRIARTDPLVLTPERLNTVVINLLRLFAEGIPDLRARAGQLLLHLVKSVFASLCKQM
ncbi:tubulin-specific chaperone D-like [Paramacrobiotus metropolitanus]|uniref:tubulin-specific chaperone D-like n=1 Tax=Paramacrobiotus metropolitanus TaxID=2943436 RepID=UPI0024457709|nr:tubulin-specific chaperone D-like [Paramacrobiotus metropolitanus]